jgi:hypothetical protein
MVLAQLFPAAMRIARVLSIHTDLSAVGVEGRFLWVLFYSLSVEIYSCIPVMFFESFISLLLELDSLLDRSHCDVLLVGNFGRRRLLIVPSWMTSINSKQTRTCCRYMFQRGRDVFCLCFSACPVSYCLWILLLSR